jgi:hypothetical protein
VERGFSRDWRLKKGSSERELGRDLRVQRIAPGPLKTANHLWQRSDSTNAEKEATESSS